MEHANGRFGGATTATAQAERYTYRLLEDQGTDY